MEELANVRKRISDLERDTKIYQTYIKGVQGLNAKHHSSITGAVNSMNETVKANKELISALRWVERLLTGGK